MVKYSIDKHKLSEEQILYIENFAQTFQLFLNRKIQSFPNLRVSLTWEVKERQSKFVMIESNASFEISKSLSFHNDVKDYICKEISVDFKVCSLLLSMKYENRENNTSTEMSEEKKLGKNDGLPTFLPQEPRYSFNQIILPEETRKRIYDDLNSIKYQSLIYDQWGFSEVDPKPKSILNFFGPPGTGKTMCAHAIAKSLDKKLLALNYSEIESKYVGDAAKNLKKAFDTATEIGAVLFFDEADSFLGKRIENVSSGSDQALNSLRSQMLILLEEFEGVVLFATNLVTNFDKAFESRIIDHIKLELPNKEARADIIDKMLPSKLPMEHRLSEEELLEASEIIEGFSGREIKSAILSMLQKKAGSTDENILFSFDDVKNALAFKKQQIEQLKAEENERKKQKILKKIQEKVEEEEAVEQHKRSKGK